MSDLVLRFRDLVLLTLVAPFLILLLILVAPVVAFYVGRPLFFRQERAGIGGRNFRLVKFRSMTEARGPDGVLLPDADRLTPFGIALRRTRLDELPSFWHILTGDISWVGPRPLPASIIAKQQGGMLRLAVRPGFTGLAQVSGNTFLSDEEKFALDSYYIMSRSFWIDLVILTKTVGTILGGERRDEALIAQALTHFRKVRSSNG